MKGKIKAGYCIAYDWEMVKKSLPRVYKYVDSICLSLDKNRISWSGKKFHFDEEVFYDWVRSVDEEKKIDIYEDDFYIPTLDPLKNDNRQRSLMAERMGKGGWHLQIDADEYFLDFESFASYLLNLGEKQRPINVCVNAIVLIKKTETGYLFVKNKVEEWEKIPIATNLPEFSAARRNGHFNHISPYFVVHETWARGEAELKNKLDSWGHINDFINKESYFNLWKSLDENNCSYIKNFHPLQPAIWQSLSFIKGRTIDEVIGNLKTAQIDVVNQAHLIRNNSRYYQHLKKIFRF